MPHRIPCSPWLLATLCCAMAPAAAHAQKIPAACQPLIDAAKKVITTPHHLYSTRTRATKGAPADTGELISVGGVTYLRDKGKWMRSPMTPQMELDQLNENLANATLYSCQRVGEESVGGVTAVVYTAHEETGELKADVRQWIAKGSGLVLRTEEDMDLGMGQPSHLSLRYEYTNVRAPAGS